MYRICRMNLIFILCILSILFVMSLYVTFSTVEVPRVWS
jgi:hypothetical protein